MSEETSPRKGIGRWLNMNLVGALLLIGATIVSFWQVFNTQKELFDPVVCSRRSNSATTEASEGSGARPAAFSSASAAIASAIAAGSA